MAADPPRRRGGDTVSIVCLGRRTALNTLGHLLDVASRRGLAPPGGGLLIVSSEQLYGQPVAECIARDGALQKRLERFAECRIEVTGFDVAEYDGPNAAAAIPRSVLGRLKRRRRVGLAVRRSAAAQMDDLSDFISRYPNRRVYVLTANDAAIAVCRWTKRRWPGTMVAWVDDGLKQRVEPSLRTRIDLCLRSLARLAAPATGFSPSHLRPELNARFDEYWVYGERRRRDLARLGIDPARAEIMGFPKAVGMDVSCPPAAEIPADRSAQTVCVAMQCLALHGLCRVDVEEGVYRDIASALLSLGFGRVIMKLHPENDANRYRKAFDAVRAADANEACHLETIVDEPMDTLLARSNVLVTLFSTAALDALLMGKLLVVIELPWLRMPLGLSDVSTTVPSVAAMTEALAGPGWPAKARRRLESGWSRFIKDEIGEPAQPINNL